MTQTAPITVTGQSVTLDVTGQPDVKNKYGSGHIRPRTVRVDYQDNAIHAQVYGLWIRENGELTDDPCDQDYLAHTGDVRDWPDWLAAVAILARGAASAVVSPPTSRAAGPLRNESTARHDSATASGQNLVFPVLAAPAAWIDGHPQLEAIAAAVWEQCGRSDSGACVEDDPRNIAVAALAAVLAVLPEPTDRAAVRAEAFTEAADFVRGLLLTRTLVTTTSLEAELRRLAAEGDGAEAQQQPAPTREV